MADMALNAGALRGVKVAETGQLIAGSFCGRYLNHERRGLRQEELADPHFQAREAILEVGRPRWGRLPMQNAFPKFSKMPGSVRRVASQAKGQDKAEVYGARWGLDADALEALAKAGVI